MRLISLQIKEYKQLKKFKVYFGKTDERIQAPSIRFLIGRNGAGKSTLLEAIALIFSRIMHDEVPGFYFDLSYAVSIGDKEKFVRVRPNQTSGKTYRIRVQVADSEQSLKKVEEIQTFFSRLTDLHPSRIVASSSGPTQQIEDALIASSAAGLVSDLYDILRSHETEKKLEELEGIRRNLLKHRQDPNFLYMDAESAPYVLIALCAILPFETDEAAAYTAKRRELLDIVKGFRPAFFTVTVNESVLKKLKDGELWPSEAALRAFCALIGFEETEEGNSPARYFDSFSRVPVKREPYAIPEIHRTFFYWMEDNGNGTYHVPKLEGVCSPFMLFSALTAAKRNGWLESAHIAFHIDGVGDLLYESDLSDGEFMWLARMGLLLIAREPNLSNMLFLLDEPDVHLNEEWISQFVKWVDSFTSLGDARSDSPYGRVMRYNHEIMIATHSTLMLTDALPDQVYLITNDEVQRSGDDFISTFAADRMEIAEKIFNVNADHRKFAELYVDRVISEGSLEQLELLLEQLGPGYNRFRLREKLFSLRDDGFSQGRRR